MYNHFRCRGMQRVFKKTVSILIICCLMMNIAPLSLFANPSDIGKVSGSNFTDEFKDKMGNEIKMVHDLNDSRLKIDTYKNGILVDYTIREVHDGVLSDVLEVYTRENSSKDIQATEFKKEVYSTNDFITVKNKNVELQSPRILPLSGPSYPVIASDYSYTWGLEGFLHGQRTVVETDYQVYDFPPSTSLGVVAAVLLYITGPSGTISLVVSITAILAGVGIDIWGNSIQQRLFGTYDAVIERYDFEVWVENFLCKVVYQEVVDIEYYSQSTGQQYNRIEVHGYPEPIIYNDPVTKNDLIHEGIYFYVIEHL